MTTGAAAIDAARWFENLKTELLATNPYEVSAYFRRFGAGQLSREQAFGHVAQNFLILHYFPRIFSGIHARCDDLEVRKVCARHLLVEDLGYYRGRVGGTPDHTELYKWIGDDMGFGREVWDRITPLGETTAVLDFSRRLAHAIPWSAALCTTALFEEEVVGMSRIVGTALVRHYGCRPERGGMNYTVHAEVEEEESGDTEQAVLRHLRTSEDVRVAESAMRELHRLLVAYAAGLEREYVHGWRRGS